VQQGNLGVEYAIDKNTSISLNYLRVKADHLQRTGDVNLGATTPQTITDVTTGQTFAYDRYLGARPYAAFARISEFQSNAGSNYNGMTAELKRRFSSSFQGAISYTWGHVIDNAPDATAVVPFSSGDDAKISMYSLNPNFDRGSGVNDQRQRFVGNFVWDLNYGKNLPKFAHALASGWTISGILQAAAGQPYSSVVGGDLNGDSNNNDRLPTLARNSFSLPATWEFDPRIARTIKLGRETRNLQLFAEAFNVFNHFNVSGVRNTQYALKTTTAVCGVGVSRCFQLQNQANAPQTYFGLPTTDVGPRTIQLGAKFNF
jgi:K+-transporting ATPase c subunit